MSDPLGRIAEHASKPYPTDHLYPSAVIVHWQSHFAWEFRDRPADALRVELSDVRNEIHCFSTSEHKPELTGIARTARIDKLQGKEQAVTRLLEKCEVGR